MLAAGSDEVPAGGLVTGLIHGILASPKHTNLFCIQAKCSVFNNNY
jgi:hypothetical protein